MGSSSRRRHHSDRSPLFVRIPTAQADALDRAAFEQRVPKQELVADLVARYLDDGGQRVVVEEGTAQNFVIGHHSFRPRDTGVLTLEEAADLLQVAPEVLEELANAGELPGRKLGEEWRFAHGALIEWLGGVSPTPADGER